MCGAVGDAAIAPAIILGRNHKKLSEPLLETLAFLLWVVLLTMVVGARWSALALSCARIAVAQSTLYTLTTSVTNPAPIPGQPFTITWTGGEANEAVYIVLNNYFPPLPNQDIIYGGMDILCKPLKPLSRKTQLTQPSKRSQQRLMDLECPFER